MSISKIRSVLYWLAKNLGHVQAGNKAVRTRSATPIVKRIGRVYAGKIASRIIGKMFK